MPSSPAETALAVLGMARAGRFADICDLFAPNLRAMVSPGPLEAAWTAETSVKGQVRSAGAPVTEPARAGLVAVRILVTLEHGALALLVSVTTTGQLASLQLAPPQAAGPSPSWESPAYADPGRFTEHDVMLGTGPAAVPGTVSLPHADGPRPAVVLLAGSGPHDRDETIGPNKPLKDLAWGLATRGVAVLRFDKVTYAHQARVREDRGFTPADEYIPHARAAITVLREHPAVDARRVHVLGHSMGATIAPQVAADEPSVAGLVIMAGATTPLQWAAIRQFRYIASLTPQAAAASEPVIEAMTRQAMLVDSPGLSPSTPASDLPFGAPAPYWLYLRGYDPVQVAAGLDKPMLILQGGRDYQVTVTEDLARWQAGLASRADVTITVYPDDNHFFFPGSGPSAPAETQTAQHVDARAITDIARWLC